MAILDRITVGDIEILSIDASPTASGITASLGSIATMVDGSGVYIKTSASITGWVENLNSDNLSLLISSITFSNYYTKGQIDASTASIYNNIGSSFSNYYTKGQIDASTASIYNNIGSSFSNYYTKGQIDASTASIYSSFSNYYTKGQIDASTASLVYLTLNQSIINKTLLSTNNVIDANKLQTYTISSSTPIDGQTITFNSPSGTWLYTNNIQNINGLNNTNQSFTSSNDSNIKLNISSLGSTHSYILEWSNILPVSRGGLGTSSFTASQILIMNSLTSSVVSSGYKFNDFGTSSTDIWSARQSIDNLITINLVGSRAATVVTNTYLRDGDGLPYNTTPFLVPYNATIKYISVSSGAVSTWIGEVRTGGVAISGATISSVANTGTYSSYNININAGTTLQLYCNGTGVNNPKMTVVLVKR